MEEKKNSIDILSNSARLAYSELKKNAIKEIQKIQQTYELTDNDMQVLLGLSESEFSALMDERLYYVIKIDTLIRINILSDKDVMVIPRPCVGNVIELFKDNKFDNSILRLLNTIGISTADEIDLFTDFLIDSINKQKKNVSN